jgi:Predicted Zn-dependent peptidases
LKPIVLGAAALLALSSLTVAAAPHRVPPPAVTRATLDNGLRVVVVHNALAPVVTTEMNYRVGSNEAPEGFPGTAHALEHMMFRGSPGLSRNQLSEISALLGGDFNAQTQQTVTQYFFTVPAQDLDIALHIESLRMRGLDATAADWKTERGAIEQEVSRDLSNPTYRMYSQLLAAMFKGTPYAHDALGTRPSFNRTPARMLRKFHQTWYAPNNAILVVVGDIDPAATLKKIRALFGNIPRKTLPARPQFQLQPVQARTLNLTTDRPYGLAVIAYRMPGYTAPDYATAQLLSDVLGSQRGELYALVPQGKALYAGFQASAMGSVGLGFAVGVFPKGGDAGALVKAMRERIARVAAKGVPADLLEAAKRQEIAQLELQKNSVSGLARAWSRALALQGLDSPQAIRAAFEKVSLADVDRLAKSLLAPRHAITAILTPNPTGKKVAAHGFGGAESFAAAPSKPVPLPAWAHSMLLKPRLPAAPPKPEVSVLDNGLRLIVLPSAVSDTVSIYGEVRHDSKLQMPKGQEGVGQVLDGLFGYGGGKLDRLAFQRALDQIGAQEQAGTQFTAQAPAAQFDRLTQLLAMNELQPALPQAAFPIVRRQVAGMVAGQMDAPGDRFTRVLRGALLPAGDPDLRFATPVTVNGLKYADVRDYYQRVFRPDETTIVVIGHVDPTHAKNVIARYFGAWKAQGPKPDLTPPPIPPNGPVWIHVPDATRLQDKVVLAQTVAPTLHDPDHYALELGNAILGQGFYASRLYRDLRERRGLVYTVGSRFDFGRKRSVYRINFGCDPGNVAQARQIVLRDLQQMRTQPVTASELRRAKAITLRQIPLSEASVDGLASNWLFDATHDLPLDQSRIAGRHFLALDAPQIRAAFHKWLRPGDFVQAVQGPTPR